MDTLVVVDRLTGELLLVAAEPSATNAAVHLTFTSFSHSETPVGRLVSRRALDSRPMANLQCRLQVDRFGREHYFANGSDCNDVGNGA